MKKAILFIFLFPLILKAQPFLDIASVYYQYSAADKPVNKNTVYTDLLSASLTLPFKVDSDYIVVNPVYENFSLTFPLTFVDRQYHTVYLPLTLLHRWNARWKTAFVFIPRFTWQPDMRKRTRDMQYGGALLTSYQRKPTLKYKIGLYYNSEYFGPFFMPLLGIDWNINSKWNLFGVLPGSMNLEYKFSRLMHAGILFRSITNSYRTLGDNFIRINDNHLKFFLDFYLTKNNVITAEAGHTLFREYKSGQRISGETDYYKMNVTDGLLFRVGYSFRIRTDKGN